MIDSETISSEVFECSDVSVFKIPPGDISMTDWNKYETNTVWRGNLKIIEEESFPESTDTDSDPHPPALPIDRIRLKLELFNNLMSGPGKRSNELWAQVYFNPAHEIKVAVNSDPEIQEETIQRTDSYRLFKIIAQIPGSQYIGSKDQNECIQVALGLKFGDKIDAYTFIERLTSYKKLFQSYVEQYKYELDMINMASLNLNDKNPEPAPGINDNDKNYLTNYDNEINDNDDDFGDFVG